MSTDRWTPADEARLTELTERKARTVGAAERGLRDALMPLTTGAREATLRVLIKRAGEFRDLLEPFDDGARAPAMPPDSDPIPRWPA